MWSGCLRSQDITRGTASPVDVSLCPVFFFATFYWTKIYSYSHSWWLSCKEPTCQLSRPGFDPRFGTIPWRRTWQPTPLFLPGESPWTEEPDRLQSMRLQRVRHDWATQHSTYDLKWICNALFLLLHSLFNYTKITFACRTQIQRMKKVLKSLPFPFSFPWVNQSEQLHVFFPVHFILGKNIRVFSDHDPWSTNSGHENVMFLTFL